MPKTYKLRPEDALNLSQIILYMKEQAGWRSSENKSDFIEYGLYIKLMTLSIYADLQEYYYDNYVTTVKKFIYIIWFFIYGIAEPFSA